MSVDVLLATRNGGKYLKEQLDSLINQTFRDFHIIVGDDFSSDDTKWILNEYKEKYPDLFTIYYADKPSGSAKNNFLGLLRLSKADYIMFCDQDDVWDKNKIETMYNKMTQTEKLCGSHVPVIIHSDLEVCDENLNIIHKSFFKMQKFNTKNTSFASALVQNIVTGCAMMANRTAVNLAINVYDGIIMHDWWLYLVASCFGKVVAIDTPLIKYRQHSSNTLGAQKIGAKKDYRKSIADTQVQAKAFADKFEGAVPKDKLKILNTYLEFKNLGKFKKVFYLFKYRLWKHSLIRRLGQIWFI